MIGAVLSPVILIKAVHVEDLFQARNVFLGLSHIILAPTPGDGDGGFCYFITSL